jgi:1-acyl-sn-glycerol-3-phosphate acyltransferase
VPYGYCYVAAVLAVYLFTYRGDPHTTGKRTWGFLRYSERLWEAFECYFQARMVAKGKLDPEGVYVFGFHPHGILPATTFWSTRGALWKKHYGFDVDVLGASIMFTFPILREFMMWSGGRDVSRKSFSHALSAKRSIILVPGGQREIAFSTPAKETMTLVTRHRGFIRLALKHNTTLVPVLSFGEDQILRNINWPSLQSRSRALYGFGYPMYPMGRWNSPMPSPQPVTVVVGDPIDVSPYAVLLDPETGNPPEEVYSDHLASSSSYSSSSHPARARQVVEELHRIYYERLRALFEEHKAEAGFPDCELTYVE